MENQKILDCFEMDQTGNKPWLFRSVIVAPIFATIVSLSYIFNIIPINFILTGAVLTLFFFIYSINMAMIQKNKDEEKYFSYLQKQDLSNLKKATTSPEIYHISQSLIVQFLNKNHSGWSFQKN